MTKKAEQPKGAAVKVVKAEGQAALVQFERDGLLQRRIVPGTEVQDGRCSDEALDLGIVPDCDVAWEALLDLGAITPAMVSNALRSFGIWTVDDLKLHDRVIIGIATNMIGAAVWDAAKRAEKTTRRK
jgi:hypothetical protein